MVLLLLSLCALLCGCDLIVSDWTGSFVARIVTPALKLEPPDADLKGSLCNVSYSSGWVACSAKQPSSGFVLRLWGGLDRLVACELSAQEKKGLQVYRVLQQSVIVENVAPSTSKQIPPKLVEAVKEENRSFVTRFWWLLVLPPMLLLLRK
jgi:hypothetical protein